ncbi:unnamed protein product [Cylindrotheca closterium]|uniref:DEP domain-containing protein n=1 Tax=Cylindrotheca closterium TaxID=2856 RepID=A0AAD2JL72_9STRA|nr:unnamed protein product [Cylindrotheca closterium]
MLKMKTDGPPKMRERSLSIDNESCSEAPLHVTSSLVVEKCQDQTPIKPARRSWKMTGDGGYETCETETEHSSQFLFISDDDDDSVADYRTVVSDITEPSAFGYLDDSSRRLHVESSWRQESIDTSFRIEALGPLQEDTDESSSPMPLIRPLSSAEGRSFFKTATKDMPPQPAVRNYSTSFGSFGDLPLEHNENAPSTVAETSSSYQPAKQAPSGLPKMAETFISGCAVGTHMFHLKKYPKTFVGNEAVDFMLSAGLACTREDAVFLGQRFSNELNLFHHVCWDHTFKDGRFFYRFNDQLPKDVRNRTPLSREDLCTTSAKFVAGMPVSKHTGRPFKIYPNTFLGEEAVNYMLNSKVAKNRPDAILLGQRMMEELDIFQPVAHSSRFKDSSHVYRFVSDNAIDDSLSSLVETVYAEQHTPASPVPTTTKPTRCTVNRKQPNMRVSFGFVQSRHFERRLDYNPATTSGPSLSLGWRFYDDLPIPLNELGTEASKLRGGRLSIQDRSSILGEWGYTTVDMSRATRLNKKVRQRRKRSLNKDRAAYVKTNVVPSPRMSRW